MEYVSVILLALLLILAVINLICINKNKASVKVDMKDVQGLPLDPKDKRDITESFAYNVKLISSVLESSNEKSNENVRIRLESMGERLEKRDRQVSERL